MKGHYTQPLLCCGMLVLVFFGTLWPAESFWVQQGKLVECSQAMSGKQASCTQYCTHKRIPRGGALKMALQIEAPFLTKRDTFFVVV